MKGGLTRLDGVTGMGWLPILSIIGSRADLTAVTSFWEVVWPVMGWVMAIWAGERFWACSFQHLSFWGVLTRSCVAPLWTVLPWGFCSCGLTMFGVPTCLTASSA